jgi:DNA modification methylase
MKPGAAFYIWHASVSALQFINAIERIGWKNRETLIWVKNSLVLGRCDYHYRHEPCLYGWKEGAGHYFIDDRTQDTIKDITPDINQMTEEQAKAELKKIYGMSSVIYEDKPLSNDIHPTMKPVNLFKRLILNSSVENENVLDLFGGSGTTIIACDQLKRNAFVMEYDPVYASAILERYESLTGEKAELVETKGKQTNVRKSKSKAS